MRGGRPWRCYRRGSHQGPPAPRLVVRCQCLSDRDQLSCASPAVRPRQHPSPAEARVTAPPGSRPSSAVHPFVRSGLEGGGQVLNVWISGVTCLSPLLFSEGVSRIQQPPCHTWGAQHKGNGLGSNSALPLCSHNTLGESVQHLP